MRALEDKLDPAQLMRVHRSAFAQPANVVEVQRLGRTINALVLRDGAIVQVGPNYSKAVAGRLKLAESRNSSPAFAGEGDQAEPGGGVLQRLEEPLHRTSCGPPPPEIRGGN